MVAFRDVLSRAQSIKCSGAKPGVLLQGLEFFHAFLGVSP